MSEKDAETVIEHLEKAKEAAAPLKDRGLERKIDEAKKHVETRLEPGRPKRTPNE